MKAAFGSSDKGYFDKVQSYERICTPSSDHGLNTANVQKIIHSQNMHFDLVINEDMFHESWLMFAYKFNAPIITICKNLFKFGFSLNWHQNQKRYNYFFLKNLSIGTHGYSDLFDHAMGLLTPISHVPHMLLPYGDEMTYSERIFNVILSLYDWWFRNWDTLPKQNEIAQRYFGHLASTVESHPFHW